MANTPFADRVALVTGAASGIGAAISHELARKGAKVVVSDLNHKNAERVVQEITDAGGTAVAAVAVGVCVSRLVAGVHYPSDVVAGAAMGAATAALGRGWVARGARDA